MSFDHRDPGTTEAVWRESAQWGRVPVLDPDHVESVVVVAAHPDDESLGAGGLIARLHAEGTHVTLVLATHGEGSHARDLSRLRIAEFKDAAAALAPGCRFVDLGLPDGGLREHRTALEDRLDDIISGTELVVAPWRGDGHRDHRIAGEVAHDVATRHAVRLLEYPIWLWHWATPDADEVPWDAFSRLPLDDRAARAKRSALEAYGSQLGAVDGEEPIIHEGMKAHFARPWETFVEARS